MEHDGQGSLVSRTNIFGTGLEWFGVERLVPSIELLLTGGTSLYSNDPQKPARTPKVCFGNYSFQSLDSALRNSRTIVTALVMRLTPRVKRTNTSRSIPCLMGIMHELVTLSKRHWPSSSQNRWKHFSVARVHITLDSCSFQQQCWRPGKSFVDDARKPHFRPNPARFVLLVRSSSMLVRRLLSSQLSCRLLSNQRQQSRRSSPKLFFWAARM